MTLLFGRPSPEAAREIVAILDAQEFVTPRTSLFDASGLDAIEPESFAIVTEYQNRRRPDLTRCVLRQAIVTPRGMPGAIVTGYRAVFEFSYPVEFFTERAAALEFLQRADALAAVDELAVSSSRPLLVRLRNLLGTSPTIVLADAAKQLGVSERSLQRYLQTEGTSFVDELQSVRIAMAKRLLAETDRKPTAIAGDVGCASLQSFSTMFRRVTGETPSEFRTRARG